MDLVVSLDNRYFNNKFGGTDVSIENKNEGFTHIFVSTFESTEGIAEYLYHPAHVEYGKKSLPYVEKFIVFDYKPTIVKL
ncbi:hypothetical protein M5K25_027562 [Dendrobium thyrsiflorum]|uniref:Stress-response A/B barrel domain-containing protein n=1 Tax=Dendrobium thyrsiflorum TaxID=117978 RepID=A0ABD0TUB4_DENTH